MSHEACRSRAIKIYGIDFISAPSRKKAITCLECVLEEKRLNAGAPAEWPQSWNDYVSHADSLDTVPGEP